MLSDNQDKRTIFPMELLAVKSVGNLDERQKSTKK